MSRRRLFPLSLIGLGLVLLASILLPIFFSSLKYYLLSGPKMYDPTSVSGLPAPRVVNLLGASTTDFYQPQTWFDSAPLPPPVSSSVKFFSISLPQLSMLDIPVEVNGADLRKNAIHFPGTALPGTRGNTVIFGHSALPQVYTKDNPLTIFNPLLKAKAGGEILLKFDGITYRYLIKSTQEVTADRIDVLTQDYDRTTLTLITCVPLGTYWRRFVVHAELAPQTGV